MKKSYIMLIIALIFVIAAGADGFMTGADKTKLNGITALADVTGDNAPQAHAASHQNTGGDEISVAGLSGLLADDQTPANHNTSKLTAGTLGVARGGTGVASWTASRVAVVSGSGLALASSSITVTKLGYLGNASSDLQDQIDAIISVPAWNVPGDIGKQLTISGGGTLVWAAA